MNEKVLLGGYTRQNGQGIYQAKLDTDQHTLSTPTLFIQTGNPTYLALDPQHMRVYTIMTQGDQGGVASYDAASSTPQLLNTVLAKGSAPAYISYDPERQLIFDANYHKGQANAYAIAKDGRLSLIDTVSHTGNGPKPEQDSAHIHYIDLTPDHRLVVCDLGIDQVTTYDFVDGHFREIANYQTKPGFGPRHIAFNPQHRSVAYLLGELSSEVTVLDYNADNGSFFPIETQSLIPDDFTDHNGSAAIHLSSDGKFLYASNRGHNSLAVFGVSTDGHKIHLLQRISTEGDFPRDFDLDPSEKFILAANQNSANLTLYDRDPVSGLLKLRQKDIVCPEAVCVKFLPA